jgi:hypothetical protein
MDNADTTSILGAFVQKEAAAKTLPLSPQGISSHLTLQPPGVLNSDSSFFKLRNRKRCKGKTLSTFLFSTR